MTARDSPYVGLDYFAEEDAAVFFGRDAERRRIIGNLRASRLTLLYAQSGVGKSSLLRAGVAARLRGQGAAASRGSRRYLPVVFSSWRDDPVPALVGEIDAAVRPLLADGARLDLPRERLEDALQAAAAAIDATPLIILDQFEEFFLYHDADAAGERFADALARCVLRPDVRAHFLVSIREDAYSRIGDRFKERIPNVYANYLHLDYLDERAAREAIREPLARLGTGPGPSRIDGELVDEVLRQVRRPGGDDGAGRFETAYLQLVMERLWDEERRQGSGVLRLETLTRIGGAGTIIRRHLREAVDGLDARERDAAAAAFRFLVTSAGTKIALTPGELAELSEQPEPLLRSALERLQEARILRPVAADGQRRGYELFHDVLGEAVVEWRKGHEAERHERALLDERAEEERRRLAEAATLHAAQRAVLVRRAALALSGLVLVLAGAVVWAWTERAAAQRAREQARSQALAASAIGQLGVDPERSVVLARAAWDTAHTDEADDALRRSLSASRVRDRFVVGPPLRAALSDGGETLATVGERRISLWRPGDRKRLAAQPLGAELAELTVAAGGGATVFSSAEGMRVLRTAAPGRPVALRRSGTAFPIALSPDGRFAAGPDRGEVPRVWSARTGRILATLPRGGRSALISPGWDYVPAMAFDPADPGRVVGGQCRGGLVSWRWRTGAVERMTAPADTARPIDPGSRCLVAVSPDGTRAVETLRRGSAVLWDLGTGRPVDTHLGDGHSVADVAFGPDGARVATASRKVATVFDARTGARVAGLAGHTSQVNAVAFSPTGDRVVTSGDDATARVWDVATGASLAILRGHAEALHDAAFTPGGTGVVTVSDDGTVRRWSVATGRVLTGHRDWVRDAASAPGGTPVATVDVRGRLLLHDPATGRHRVLRRRAGPAFRELSSVAYDRSGRRIAIAGDVAGTGGRVVVLDARSGRTRQVLRTGEPAGATSFSPDGRWILTAPRFGPAQLWRLRDEERFTLPTPGPWSVVDAAFSPDGRSIVTAGGDGVARIFDAATRRPRAVTYRHRGTLAGATFSPDGRTVLSYGSDGTAHLWDAASGDTLHVLRGHTAWIGSGAFSPDGDRVVTGGADETTRVWEVRTGRLLSTQRMHGDSVNSVAFTPGGASILSASDDRTARIYPCETCAPTGALARLADRRVFFSPAEADAIVAAERERP